jgi:S-formylglutathione hydrolase FrmB
MRNNLIDNHSNSFYHERQRYLSETEQGVSFRRPQMIALAAFAAMVCVCGSLPAQPQPLRTQIDSLYAPSLERAKKFMALLPKRYSPPKRYPILYLLHGWGGTYLDWTAKTEIKKYIDDFSMVVVLPDAENSWYVDSATEPQNRFETYLMNDLPKALQEKYSIDTTKQAIVGLSMGGYGALAIGLRHPKRFKFIGSLSGIVAAPRESENRKLTDSEKLLAPSLRAAFGEYGNEFRSSHDPFTLYKSARPDSLPYIYLVVGVRDGYPTLLPRHHEFIELLHAYGASYEYHETPGEHNWGFWDKEVQNLLKKMKRVLRF